MSKIEQLEKMLADNNMSKAKERLEKLFDEGSFVEIDALLAAKNQAAPVVTGYGFIDGATVFAFCQDGDIAGGKVTAEQVAKIKKIYDMALKVGAPVVGIYDSKGGDISQGGKLLGAFSEMLKLTNSMSGVVPQISVIVGTCAGVLAMSAVSADFVIMSKKAELFLISPFVANANGKGAENSGTATNAAKTGVAHILAQDEDMAIEKAKDIIGKLPANNLSPVPVFEYSENQEGIALLQNASQDIEAADIKDVIEGIVDEKSCVELLSEFGCETKTYLASIAGITTGVVYAKGYLCKDCTKKIARVVSVCDSFSIPVLTIVDCEGFVPSSIEELAGSLRDAAKLANVYQEATCAKVSLIVGKAYGSAYVALSGVCSSTDITIAWPTATITPLAPNASITVLYPEEINNGDRATVLEKYIDEEASALAFANKGYIEQVINPVDTRKAVVSAFDLLSTKRTNTLPKKHGNVQM